MKNVRKAILIAVVALFSIEVYAQQQEVLTFTRIERSPRAAALAGAGAASVGSAAYASFTNSAIIPFYDGKGDFAAGWEYWAPALGAANAMSAAGAYNFGPVGVSLGGVYQMEQPYGDGFKPSEFQVNLGVGVKVLPWLGFGLNARYAQETIFQGYSNKGFGMDVMALFAPVKGLTVVAGAANIGTKVQDSAGNGFPQPMSILAAAAYNLEIGTRNFLEFMLDENYYLASGTNAVSFGMEYSFDHIAFARIGYRIASNNAAYPSHLSFGLGAQFKGFRIDVSYLTLSEVIGNTVAIGLGYRF
ncbi:MAG: PorV/PorQ family protein [Bacteroidales bacterium]|nr:PorV/PorQ family protein [Bacteroidales bacterium]